MPELPEVETVRRQMQHEMGKNPRIKKWIFHRSDLRFILPQRDLNSSLGQEIKQISRRAKYILIKLKTASIISHLGMTGSWRKEVDVHFRRRKHDHVELHLSNGHIWVYEDPRRFGFIKWIENDQDLKNEFEELGPEPFLNQMNFDQVVKKFRQSHTEVKIALLNQKLIVGIGNIYASEILFRAKIHPQRTCSSIEISEWDRILKITEEILTQAIESGGSTIQNYKNTKGESGAFQKQHLVYGKKNNSCLHCSKKILCIEQAGRSTFFCQKCQPMKNKKSRIQTGRKIK